VPTLPECDEPARQPASASTTFERPAWHGSNCEHCAGRAFPSEQSLSTIVLILAEEDERPTVAPEPRPLRDEVRDSHEEGTSSREEEREREEKRTPRAHSSAARSTAAAALAALAALATPGTALA